jgi:hypothetical protein
MKNFFIALLAFSICNSACKKKEFQPNPGSVSNGNLLVLVVSDTLEYAIEYDVQEGQLSDSPGTYYAEFDNATQVFDVQIAVGPFGALMLFQIDPFTEGVSEYPEMLDMGMPRDSIPTGSYALGHTPFPLQIDSTHIHFIHPSAKNWTAAWTQISNLRIVKAYRNHSPNSKIGFYSLKNNQGIIKNYFLLVKV